MKVDYLARQLLMQKSGEKNLAKVVSEALSKNRENNDLKEPISDIHEAISEQAILTTFLLQILQNIEEEVSDLASLFTASKDGTGAVIAGIKIPEFPQEMSLNPSQVTELVESIKGIKIPDAPEKISISNLTGIIEGLKEIKITLKSLKQEAITKVEGKVEITNPVPQVDILPIIKAIDSLRSEIKKVPSGVKESKPVSIDLSPLVVSVEEMRAAIESLVKKEVDFPREVSVNNFPRQMTPTPVTKIDINPLRGEFKSNGVTVNTTAVPLPGTPLSRRRSLIVYNNDTSATLYVGGSDVTTTGAAIGLPVPPKTYSPPFDAASNMVLYGISTSSITVVVLEASNDYGTTSTTNGSI